MTSSKKFKMALTSLVSYGESSDSDSEEYPASSKKDSERDVRKLLSVLPPAKVKSGGGRQTVRIGLPKLRVSLTDSSLPRLHTLARY